MSENELLRDIFMIFDIVPILLKSFLKLRYISGGFRMSATTDSVIDGASMVLLLETLIDDSKIMRKTQDEKMA